LEKLQCLATERNRNKKVICPHPIISVHLKNQTPPDSRLTSVIRLIPIPYRTPTDRGHLWEGSRWYTWQVEDQRFVSSRPDVISFTSDSLTADLTVTGKIMAHCLPSTSGTDADWVVKLIDVYPNHDPINYLMSQYQFPVAMEVFRGRFRKSFSDPVPMTAK
jgi:predicted acyl esterase